MNTKICATCNIEKPMSEFYLHKPSGTIEKHCKKCKLARQKTYTPYPIGKSGVPHEQDIIDKLKSMGIYACSGKLSRHRWVDIVAWGCVTIEAKLGCGKINKNGKSPQWHFQFTKKQRDEGIRGDILIFMMDVEDETRYYVMPSDYPELYRNGRLKGCITYNPFSTDIRSKKKRELFEIGFRNNWGLIEVIRQAKSHQLSA